MVYIGMARYVSHVRCKLYYSPRNDQPSAKTSQTSLTDLSLAIATAYESIHTFVFSHEKSLIRLHHLLSSSSSSSSSSVKRLAGKCEASNVYTKIDLRWSEVCIDPKRSFLLPSHVSSENLWSLHESTMNDAILDSVPRLLRPRARVL